MSFWSVVIIVALFLLIVIERFLEKRKHPLTQPKAGEPSTKPFDSGRNGYFDLQGQWHDEPKVM